MSLCLVQQNFKLTDLGEAEFFPKNTQNKVSPLNSSSSKEQVIRQVLMALFFLMWNRSVVTENEVYRVKQKWTFNPKSNNSSISHFYKSNNSSITHFYNLFLQLLWTKLMPILTNRIMEVELCQFQTFLETSHHYHETNESIAM